MKRYKAVLFAPDGDWVTDYEDQDSIEEVNEHLADQGSRWFFYPFPFVIRDHQIGVTKDLQRILDTPDGFECFRGMSIRTMSRWLKDNPETVEQMLQGG